MSSDQTHYYFEKIERIQNKINSHCDKEADILKQWKTAADLEQQFISDLGKEDT